MAAPKNNPVNAFFAVWTFTYRFKNKITFWFAFVFCFFFYFALYETSLALQLQNEGEKKNHSPALDTKENCVTTFNETLSKVKKVKKKGKLKERKVAEVKIAFLDFDDTVLPNETDAQQKKQDTKESVETAKKIKFPELSKLTMKLVTTLKKQGYAVFFVSNGADYKVRKQIYDYIFTKDYFKEFRECTIDKENAWTNGDVVLASAAKWVENASTHLEEASEDYSGVLNTTDIEGISQECCEMLKCMYHNKCYKTVTFTRIIQQVIKEVKHLNKGLDGSNLNLHILSIGDHEEKDIEPLTMMKFTDMRRVNLYGIKFEIIDDKQPVGEAADILMEELSIVTDYLKYLKTKNVKAQKIVIKKYFEVSVKKKKVVKKSWPEKQKSNA